MKPIKTILCATDLSEHSRCALEVACALARDHGARLLVLHAVPVPATVVSADVGELRRGEHFEADSRSYEAEMAARLQELPVPAGKVRVERILKEGEAAQAILQTAVQSGADLIVIGTHGRSGYFQKLMGSVAAEVSRKAPCPVVTVKSPAETSAS